MRLIDADALKKALNYKALLSYTTMEEFIDNAPTIPLPDFKEGYKQAILDGKTNFTRPQGEWIIRGFKQDCSNCGFTFSVDMGEDSFCPHCGADMRGDAK